MTVEEVQSVIKAGGFLYIGYLSYDCVFAPKALGDNEIVYGTSFQLVDSRVNIRKADFWYINNYWREATQEEIEKWVPIEYRIDKTSNQN